ncbi:MAG: right-handed parallel beta-helix repeat-containing protein [Tannerella sp.]|jgi:hypothetical protein|nr:right-handed parallel beta-helix repeat-containing protein [Tannerella sp.]
MNRITGFLFAAGLLLTGCARTGSTFHADGAFHLSACHPHADGLTDDTPAFRQLLEQVGGAGGGVVTIPPGDYFLSGSEPLPVPSRTTVFAYGARFFLPQTLGDQARIVLFEGTDVTDFTWFGGFFKGYCFDPAAEENPWEPNVTTRIFVVQASERGVAGGLKFRDISADRVAGAVVNVIGYSPHGEDSDDHADIHFVTDVSVENCTFLNTGKFMWDYGYLWQLLVFAEEYAPAEVEMAQKYFFNELIRKNVRIEDGGNRVYFDNTVAEPLERNQTLCFYHDRLPDNIVRGKRYYVAESTAEYITVSEQPDGKQPVTFRGAGGDGVQLVSNLWHAFMDLYAPKGAGPGKGCIDLMRCRNTKITGCTISAQGDAMHVYCSQNNLIANNQILGARMGAFFLAEYSKNSTVTGNTVDGTNGSRVLSIERSNEDVTLVGNVFRNGGRGCWINQPKNLVIQGNVFVNNTTKGIKDPRKGRRDFKTGGWQSFPELYFSTYQPGATYGPVLLSGNLFETSTEAAAVIHFAEYGRGITVSGNTFSGATGLILTDEDSSETDLSGNRGATVRKGKDPSLQFANE